MVNFQKDNLLKKIPSDWQVIKPEEYPIYGVFSREGFTVYEAYKTSENVVTVASYESEENFLKDYAEQLAEIKNMLRGKDWKTLSTINPLFFDYAEHNGIRVYLSVFEAYNSKERVALQIFAENKFTVGFLTNIPNQPSYQIEYLVKNVKVVEEILSILK